MKAKQNSSRQNRVFAILQRFFEKICSQKDKIEQIHRGGDMRSRRKILRHEPLEERRLLAVDLMPGGAVELEQMLAAEAIFPQPSDVAAPQIVDLSHLRETSQENSESFQGLTVTFEDDETPAEKNDPLKQEIRS